MDPVILWRRILGQVTDAWYLRPSMRWDIFPGLVFDGAIIYSQALYSQSTPSAVAAAPTGDDRWQERQRIPAHEFHYSSLENLPADSIYAYKVERGHGIDGVHDGYQRHNLLAGYVHRRGAGELGWIEPFLNQVRARKARAAT